MEIEAIWTEVRAMKAEQLGALVAMQDCVRALLMTHHDQNLVLSTLRAMREQSLATLLATTLPERGISAYDWALLNVGIQPS